MDCHQIVNYCVYCRPEEQVIYVEFAPACVIILIQFFNLWQQKNGLFGCLWSWNNSFATRYLVPGSEEFWFLIYLFCRDYFLDFNWWRRLRKLIHQLIIHIWIGIWQHWFCEADFVCYDRDKLFYTIFRLIISTLTPSSRLSIMYICIK